MQDTVTKPSQSGLIFAIIFASIIISGSLIFFGLKMTEADDTAGEPGIKASLEELVDNDPMIGNKDAKVTIVEFSDYQCPYCNRHFAQTFPLILRDYIETNKIAYVYRDYPLSFHADATPAAIAAECAREQQGDEAYFRMHDKIFGGVAKTGTIPREVLNGYASELSLNYGDFTICMDSEERLAEVASDIEAGTGFGVTGTPGFIITNGKTSKVIKGAQPYSVFKKEIEALL